MKKIIRKLLVMYALVAIVGIGASFAYLKDQTEPLVNSFTSNRSIRIELKEPSWDGYQFGEEITGTPGSMVKPGYEDDITLGINRAKVYLPGDSINKNPTIKNVSKTDNAYVAFKLIFTNNEGLTITRAQFESSYGKLNIGSEFEEVISDNGSLFIYNKVLNTEQSTTLFTKVDINKDIALVNGKLPSFIVEATGYAVQDSIGFESAKAELITLAK
ncbi:MAG: hypothetical protein RR500_09540 [Bacilli bacterium]